jgi:histidinol-phosphate aminotransferase
MVPVRFRKVMGIMPVSRRGFLSGRVLTFTGALVASRGMEAGESNATQDRAGRANVPPGVAEIRINSNENPIGPGKTVLEAIVGKFPEAGRYPFNSTPNDGALVSALASKYRIKPENVVLGGGSQEILKNAVRAFTSPSRGLVTGAPTFENCAGTAKRLGHRITEVTVDSAFRLDLDSMIAASKGAGLIFFNNPNNPTATVHGARSVADFVARVRQISPDTVILIDEAYHDYVTDSSYESAIALALDTPNLFVTRTLSKAYGMAGMRIGYAIGRADTLKPLEKLRTPYGLSVFGIAAAITALNDPKHIVAERARNTSVRTYTLQALIELGCKTGDSQANFVWVDVGKPAKDFREACAKEGVVVGRDFPPFEKTHVRISIGTQDEMRKAVAVFRRVLRPVSTTTTGSRMEAASWH